MPLPHQIQKSIIYLVVMQGCIYVLQIVKLVLNSGQIYKDNRNHYFLGIS